MKKMISKLLAVSMLAGVLAFPVVQASPNLGRTYLLYEDFNDMTDGQLPGGLIIETGAPASIQKTVRNAQNGNYAMKLTSGSEWYALGMRLNKAVTSLGNNDIINHNDAITIEYDLKNEYGGFGLSWLTSEELSSGVQRINNKKILNLGNVGTSTPTVFGAATTDTAYWGGPDNPHSWTDYGAVEGDTTFDFMGSWVHVTMTLDGQQIDDEDYGNRFMYAEISWYELDNPYITYTVSRAGSGLSIESSGGAYEYLSNIRQRDIASVVIPVAAAANGRVPTMEIDNLEVYLTRQASTPSPVAPTITGVKTVPGTTGIRVDFSKEIGDNIVNFAKIKNADGTVLSSNIALANDNMSITISPIAGQSISDYITLVIDKYAMSRDGGIMNEKYESTIKAPKKYLFHEDFNDMTNGTMPDGMNVINGTSPIITKTTVDAQNGDYAMKFTPTGDNANGTVTGFAMNLSEAVYGLGTPEVQNHSDRITIEYDLKNEHGAFGLSWLTSEEVSAGYTSKVWRKKPLLIANSNKSMWPLPTGTNGTWYGQNNPSHAYGDEGMVSGNTTFSSFGKWIHVTMILDGEAIENDYRDRFMYAEVSWYEKDSPETVYRAYCSGNSGRGMFIENSSGSYVNELGGYRQTNIASVVLPVFYYNTGSLGVPTVEIDNVEIYLTNSTQTVAYGGVSGVTFADNGSSGLSVAPAMTTGLTVDFATAMPTNIGNYITLTCNGVTVPATGVLSGNGMSYTITPDTPLYASTQYVLTVKEGAWTLDGGIVADRYVNTFTTGAGSTSISDFAVTNGNSPISVLPAAGSEVNLSLTANSTCVENVWLIIAQYKYGKLVSSYAENKAIEIGNSTYNLTNNMTVSSGIDTIKGFCWTYKDHIPLAESVSVPIQ